MPSSTRHIPERTMETLRRLARWSARCRDLLGLSQDRASRGAGISQGGVSRIESGKCVGIPLVSYLALAHYYAGVSTQHGVAITDPATFFALPEQAGLVTLDPTRQALLALLTEASPTQQRLLLEIARVVLRRPAEPV